MHKLIKILFCGLKLFFLFSILSCSYKKNNDISKAYDYSKLSQRILVSSNDYDSLKNNILSLPNDSLKRNLIFNISYGFLINDDSLKFRKWNERSFDISYRLNELNKIAESNWDLANFLYKKNKLDSAYIYYQRAFDNYSKYGEDLLAGRMLLSMGVIQENFKDYIGSEIATIEALKLIEPNGKKEDIYNAYNNLGVFSNGLEDYESSLNYHKKALAIATELDEVILLARTLNNIGVVYKELEDYDKALYYYNTALNLDSLFYKNAKLYSMLLDNTAYSEFLSGNDKNFLQKSLRSLKIRDSIKHDPGIIVNNIHLSEFYTKKNISIADDYAREALNLSLKSRNFDYILESLLLVTKTDSANANIYLKQYIKINDSLQKEERSIRNKFAKIRFETDEYIAKSNKLSEEKFEIIIIGGACFIILLVLFFVKAQKSRNKELLLEREQYKTNEKIYNLLLTQQIKLEEGRQLERTRISEELHDGILGELFGTRMKLGFYSQKYTSNNSIKELKDSLENLQKIEKEIRNISHDLVHEVNENDVGFIQLIKELVSAKNQNANFSIDFTYVHRINWEIVDNEVKINIYRIIQESLQNAFKHSNGDNIIIKIEGEYYSIDLKISDNGTINSQKHKSGIGLKNIKNRIAKMKGQISIENDERGFHLTISIPVNLQV